MFKTIAIGTYKEHKVLISYVSKVMLKILQASTVRELRTST